MALPADRNSREYQTFTLDSSGAVALNVVGIATGTGTATSTAAARNINDGQFRMFVLGSAGVVAFNLKST